MTDAVRPIRREDPEEFASNMARRKVPKRFWAMAMRETDAVKHARALLEKRGVILVLAGNAGCGKSAAAAWALAREIGIWVNTPDLARPSDIDERMGDAPLLVLDDVGLEYSTDRAYAQHRIVSAINSREASMRPTLITTNLSAEEFKERYGERTASRINGDALGWQTIVGPDLRRSREP